MTATASGPVARYTKEQRMSVVMYGGVSLAIYIGGVAKEMLALVRASGRGKDDSPRAALAPAELDGVERVYRQLAQWDGAAGTTALDMKDGAPLLTRYVIDVISGTSAGGINGVFLARALAESSTLDSISKLWIEEGDLGKLLNDGASLEGLTGLVQQDPPVSLLNGERMYRILLNAFGQMVPGPSKVDAGDRIDLYVTTTDVRGEVVRLKLANGFSTEKRYRQAFHFVHEPAADPNHFADDREARLALGARRPHAVLSRARSRGPRRGLPAQAADDEAECRRERAQRPGLAAWIRDHPRRHRARTGAQRPGRHDPGPDGGNGDLSRRAPRTEGSRRRGQAARRGLRRVPPHQGRESGEVVQRAVLLGC